MESALERGDLVEALSHLDSLINSSSPGDLERCKLLGEQTVKDLPTLHHLASFHFQEEDIPHLDKLIKILTDFGYDINKTVNMFEVWGSYFYGFTALLASVQNSNPILMECLLRHGARQDIRDERGYSPCHRAVKVGDLSCLEKLVQFGGPSVLATTAIEKSGTESVHPLLHTAVDEGRLEMVSFFLNKQIELEIDVNEKASYPYSYHDDEEDYDDEFTPLDRAIRKEDVRMVQILLEQSKSRIQWSRFSELHSCLDEGHTVIVNLLLDHFSVDQLTPDKIEDWWALLSLYPRAFQDRARVEFTRKVVLKYVEAGWDVNAENRSSIRPKLELVNDCWAYVTLTKYTLLHLACLFGGQQDIIKALVEEAKADVNRKTEGYVELTPLHILIILRHWQSASYLIDKGADLNMRGNFNTMNFSGRNLLSSRVVERWNPSPSIIGLLVSLGCVEGLAVLDKVLARPDIVWDGGAEFHLALDGHPPIFALKVLQNCAKIITKEDLTEVAVLAGFGRKAPTLMLLFDIFRRWGIPLTEKDALVLVDFIQLMVTLGYDLNLRWGDTSILSVLYLNFLHKPSRILLLKSILQFDNVQINNTDDADDEEFSHSHHLIVSLLKHLDETCSGSAEGGCKMDPLPSWPVEVLKLLVAHGLDLSEMGIHDDISFHCGSAAILKLLYTAGAWISKDVFASDSLCPRFRTDKALLQEHEEFKKWKVEFDGKEEFSLKHMCRLRIRKMLKCVGDLKMLDGIPESLKNYVLCKD